jgi:DNA-binding NarL/FixJ family response regulator
MTIRVLVADDQSMVRAGFRMLLAREQDIEVVAEASNGLEAVDKAARFRPSVVLMDIRMPELDGLQATRRILAADGDARILILTTFDLDEYVYEALRAGASGFVLKDDPPEQLIAAIRIVADGDALLSPAITKLVIKQFARIPQPAPPPQLEELTERELEVFRLIARGLSNAKISEQLYISDTTVKTHITHILQKLDLRDRSRRSCSRTRRGCSTSPLPRRGLARASPNGLERLLAAHEGVEAVVLLAASGAPVEVRAQSGNGCVGVGAGSFELDIAVELVEAGVAAYLRPRRAQEPAQRLLEIGSLHHFSSEFSSASPRSSRCFRSFRRASCSVLYSALRLVLSRSARTSIGTPFTDSATRTRRWCGVSTCSIAFFSAPSSSLCSASASGPRPAFENRLQPSGSSGTSRLCQARFRSLTAAS